MGKKLDKQSPLCKLMDSLKKQRKLEEKMVPDLHCEEVKNPPKKVFGSKTTLRNLPITVRVGIAKWFIKRNLYSIKLENILKVATEYTFSPTINEIKEIINKNYPKITEVDPVAKYYINKEEFKEITGEDYINDAKQILITPTITEYKTPKQKKQERRKFIQGKDEINKMVFSKSDAYLRKLSINGTAIKKRKKKEKK